MLGESCLGRVGLAVGKPEQCLLALAVSGEARSVPVDIGGQWLFKTDMTHLGLVKTETLSELSGWTAEHRKRPLHNMYTQQSWYR